MGMNGPRPTHSALRQAKLLYLFNYTVDILALITMYLFLIVISIIALFYFDWRIALPILVIVFSLDRIVDSYRRELEQKIKNSKK